MPQRSAREVHAALVAALERLRRAERSAVLLFAEVLRRKLYRPLGHPSIQTYAAKELGFTAGKTREFVRLAESLESLPRLSRALREGEIGWTKARTVARVASPSTERDWLRSAKACSSRRLEAKVKAARQGRPDAGPNLFAAAAAAGEPEPAANAHVGFVLAPELKARLDACIEGLRKRGDRRSREELLVAAFESLLAEAGEAIRDSACDQPTAAPVAWHGAATDSGGGEQESSEREEQGLAGQRLESENVSRDARGVRARRAGEPRYQIVVHRCDRCGGVSLPDGRRLSRAAGAAVGCDARVHERGKRNRATIPPARRREVLARDGHRCAMPGCGATGFLEIHHVMPREMGGGNGADNLITLCSSCHRFLHAHPGAWSRTRESRPNEL